MAKIQRDLDETKIILHKTIESVLDRGEKLDQVGWGPCLSRSRFGGLSSIAPGYCCLALVALLIQRSALWAGPRRRCVSGILVATHACPLPTVQLVDKSADLSMASQLFYKQARKANSCCRFM